jgi:hypothetical protein
MQDVTKLISEFGFPIVMAVGMGYYIYYIWKFVINRITPKLDESHMSLIKVIDQIRMLDNDLIRLQQKVNVVLEYEQIYGGKKPSSSKSTKSSGTGRHSNS